jgi:hypothetical protein
LRIVGQLIEDSTAVRIDLMFVTHEICEGNAHETNILVIGTIGSRD